MKACFAGLLLFAVALHSYLPVSVAHFFINDVLAAPANGFPFLSTAFSSQAEVLSEAISPSHFFIKEDFAAPLSGLPFLSTAFASQLDAVGAAAALLADEVAAP